MSAVVHPSRRKRAPRHTVRATIRDGAIVRVKFCEGCGQDKVVTEDKDSHFPRNGFGRDGRPKWKALCKLCSRASQRKYRHDNAVQLRARASARHAERMRTDPAYREKLRIQSRDRARAKAQDPEWAERRRKREREWKRRRRLADPQRVNEEQRIDYTLRRERQGKRVRRSRTVVDGTEPRITAAPFCVWLVAYQQRRQLPSQLALAKELGITERRVRSVLRGEYARVAQDVVDRALCNAVEVLYVNGRWVVGLEDLYPELAA